MRQHFLRWFRDLAPDAVLWRSTLAFQAVETFFTGLVGAYAFQQAAVPGVLAFIAVQQFVTLAGHAWANRMMSSPAWPALRTQRAGVAGLAVILLVAGLAPLPSPWNLVLLSAGGGFCRGVTYGARLWMEANLKGGGVRQSYLAMTEASGVVLRLSAPSVALAFLWFSPRVENVFFAAGILALVFLVLSKAPAVSFGAPGPTRLLTLWRQREYWATAPYYFVEGMGHALRTALFVSGAMTVVGSIKGYALVEIGASLVAAGLLVAQSRKAVAGPSLHRLRLYLALLGAGWVALAAAMAQPWLLPVFVVLYAFSFPLVSTQKAGITLTGIVKAPGSRESNLMGRAVLLVVARVGILALFLVAYLMGVPQAHLLLGMVGCAVLLLPLEYATAKHLHDLPVRPSLAGLG